MSNHPETNISHIFTPPLLIDMALSPGWYFGALRTTEATGRYTLIDGGPGAWAFTPRKISFEITITVNDRIDRITVDDYALPCEPTFAWPTVGNLLPVVAYLARDKIGGHDACALTEIRTENGSIGRIDEPGTGMAHD